MRPEYLSPEMAAIFSDEHAITLWRDVELAILDARVELGLVDPGAAEAARRSSRPQSRTWRGSSRAPGPM